MRTKDGKSRKFAFVGLKTPDVSAQHKMRIVGYGAGAGTATATGAGTWIPN